MKNIYKDNQEISLFVLKAQNKIADLATLTVNRGGDISNNLLLALELMDFLECLDSEYCYWTVDQVISWTQEYSYRANLNSIAYLNLLGFNTTVITGGSFTTITSANIIDFDIAVNNIIRSFLHNNLSGLQGGTITQRYHIDKQMYDYLYNIVHPFIPSTVQLNITPNRAPLSTGYYELGTSVTMVTLSASIQYNNDKQAIYYEYTKNSGILGARNTTPALEEQPNPYIDNVAITSDITYSFNASFSDGIKSSSKSILFRQPMYYGLIRRDIYNNVSLLIQGTKLVKDRGELNIDFDIPQGNTLITDGTYLVPFIFFPGSWGPFATAFNTIFDFRSDWKDFGLQMPLANNTTMDGILSILDSQLEGLNTFKINW